MRARATLAAIFLLLLPAASLIAGGAGGVDFGYQFFDVGLSSADMGMSYITGYGYGVSGDGNRIGGFGSSFLSGTGEAAGGVGGMLVGHEWRAGPVVVALTLWGGLGGGAWRGHGYMLAYGAAQAELGVRVVPWMQIVAYAGYQVIGNVVPGALFSPAALWTPVLGVRIGWGSFY